MVKSMTFPNILTTLHEQEWWDKCGFTEEGKTVSVKEEHGGPPLSSAEILKISAIIQRTIDGLNPNNSTEWEAIKTNVEILNKKFLHLLEVSSKDSNSISLKNEMISYATLQSKVSVLKIKLESKWRDQNIGFNIRGNSLEITFDDSTSLQTISDVIKDLPQDLRRLNLKGKSISAGLNDSKEALNLCEALTRLCDTAMDTEFSLQIARDLLKLADDDSQNADALKQQATLLYNKVARTKMDEEGIVSALEIQLEASQRIVTSRKTDVLEGIQSSHIPIPRIPDLKVKEIDLGSHLSEQDTSDLKSGKLHFVERKLQTGSILECEFKVSTSFRDSQKLQMELMQENASSIEKFLMENGICQGFKVSNQSSQYWEKQEDTYSPVSLISEKAYRIDLKGVGSVIIGNDPSYPSLYNRVVIQIDNTNLTKEEIYQKLHVTLHLLGMGTFLQSANEGAKTRYQMAVLLHEYFPAASYELTQAKNYKKLFSLPVEELKQAIIQKVPEMKAIFDNHLGKMQSVEILPGSHEFILEGCAQECYNNGARALVQGIGQFSPSKALQTQITILKSGALSTQTKYSTGISYGGDSPEADHKANAADSVFLRLVTEKNVSEKKSLPISQLALAGRGQLIYDLELLNRPSYQYLKDLHGSRVGNEYQNRKNKENLIAELNQESNENLIENEFMFKHRVPPNYICGMIVHDFRPLLANFLIKENIITTHEGGHFFNGREIDLTTFLTESNEDLVDLMVSRNILLKESNQTIFDEEAPYELIGIPFKEAVKDWKQAAIDLLMENGLILEDSAGLQVVNGIPLNQFLHVSDEISHEMLQTAQRKFIK